MTGFNRSQRAVLGFFATDIHATKNDTLLRFPLRIE
ncbi:hypothetical protein AG1IA_05499 [Rhizoctonia solani AG-1 IA]|uniref:Uncharacterized protein n=1 Tax=Thanatephorus cucumeris (strain AG1-IA) TaxID=983506 RepID=L8WUN2_THACA|nr:hypothetical protein AG1IA_05499 [Rhizoctonia solani AG-1 IA]